MRSFKSLGDKAIKEQHFATRDFLEAVSYSFSTIVLETAFYLGFVCFDVKYFLK